MDIDMLPLLFGGMLADHHMFALLKYVFRELLTLIALTMKDSESLDDVAELFRCQMAFVAVIRRNGPRCTVLTLGDHRMLVIIVRLKLVTELLTVLVLVSNSLMDFEVMMLLVSTEFKMELLTPIWIILVLIQMISSHPGFL